MRLSELGGDVKSFMRRYNTSFTAGGLAGSGLLVSSLLGLPVPAAIGVSTIAGAHVAGAVYDMYKNSQFKRVYQNFMSVIEKREIIIAVYKRLEQAFRVSLYKRISKEMKFIDEDIRHFGKLAIKLVAKRIDQASTHTQDKYIQLRDQIKKAMKRKVSLTESEEEALYEVLAPVMLTANLVKKINERTQTRRRMALLNKVVKGDNTKYTVDEVLSLLAVDFVRDYRINLIDGETFAGLMSALSQAKEEGNPSSLLIAFQNR